MEINEVMSEIDEQIIEANKATQAAQEMLGFVLLAVGEPVIVPKQLIHTGIPTGATIAIDENIAEGAFIFSVQVDPVEDEK